MGFITHNKIPFSIIFLFIFSFIIFLPSLKNDFVWDDVALIERSVTKFESANLNKTFFPNLKLNKKLTYYRPAIILSFIDDHRFWKKNPFGYHLTNNIIFSINELSNIT